MKILPQFIVLIQKMSAVLDGSPWPKEGETAHKRAAWHSVEARKDSGGGSTRVMMALHRRLESQAFAVFDRCLSWPRAFGWSNLAQNSCQSGAEEASLIIL
jgi:hypothetical protein